MDLSSARILVVDDQITNVRLLERILRRAGFADPLGTTDPTAATELFVRHSPDLVLLDLHMPGMDGFEVMEALLALVPPSSFLPVLVITGDLAPDVRQRALSSGARDFVHKPFDPGEVVLRIRNLLEIRSLHQELQDRNRLLEERVRERTRELEIAQDEILERLAQAAELHDDITGLHTRRVGELAAALGEELGLGSATVELLRRTAPLHDVGKIGISDALLRKPGRLTPEERAIMEEHTVIGARILAGGRSAPIRMAEQIALSHHERWDGMGYPHRLSGAAIPLVARIVAVADFFDALAHDRPYRAAWPRERVVEAIAAERGRHFDPAVVDALASVLPRLGPHKE